MCMCSILITGTLGSHRETEKQDILESEICVIWKKNVAVPKHFKGQCFESLSDVWK